MNCSPGYTFDGGTGLLTLGRHRQTRYQAPNPLDLMFLAIDRAAQRLGLAGRYIGICLELRGHVDLTGLRQAVAALHRVYPVTASRLECSSVLGRPRWRLDLDPPLTQHVVRVHDLAPPTETQFLDGLAALVADQADLRRQAPLRVHVFRGLPAGDTVAISWPHALMDGQGGALIAEEIQRLYQEKPAPHTWLSAGDEYQEALGALATCIPRPSSASALRRVISRRYEQRTPDLQLPICPPCRELGPLRSVIRRLSAAEVDRATRRCDSLCPGVRFGAFLRACALRALDRIMPGPKPAGASYSVPYLIEGRRPPYRQPICRNLFSLERIKVPCAMSSNVAAVARLLHTETARMLAAGPGTRYLETAVALSRLPTGLLAELVRRAIVAPTPGWQRGGLADTPSLPLGFMRVFPQGLSQFCGATLRRAALLRPPFPRTGLALQATAEHGRLTICGLAYECRLAMLDTLLDELVATLLG